MKKAVFLDRDGTINEDVGDLYEIQNVRFIPGAIEAMKRLAKEFSLFIVTNQSGIGKGVFDLEQYGVFEREYNALLEREGVHIVETYCCPHRKDQPCVCRKPSPHYMTAASERHGIDLSRSFAVGDHPHDIEMGRNAGSRTVYLLTGHGERHKGELVIPPDHIAGNLAEAAEWICSL
ncbi:MAG: HAD family hydrolase [Spirochaetes bacterium]|jgi:D-glycero-D-manno-heptose 1,7-bisphosphate phosphatase|nr:HAD family hydrolase [Spirochaetota bacterium]